MSDHEVDARRMLDDIFATRDDELYCDAAQTLIARISDACLSDLEARQLYPELWHHFRFCVDCATEYALVQELTQREAAGQLRKPAHIHPRPVYFPTLTERLQNLRQRVFPGFTPNVVAAVTRGLEPTEIGCDILLEPGELTLTLDLLPNPDGATYRDLYGTLASDTSTQTAEWEGAILWLVDATSENVLQERTLNELGEVTFEALRPGTYQLYLLLRGQTYQITDLTLP